MPERILVFIPMYNCEKQIVRVLDQFDEETQRLFAEIVLVDNRSSDGGVAVAAEGLRSLTHVTTTLIQNDENYGLGGSHKVAFNYAIDNGFDYCVVLHGDDQGRIEDLVPYLKSGAHREQEYFLGARFMRGSRLIGYSRFRTFGNRVFNSLFSIVCRRSLKDLGSGLNIFAVSGLRDREYLRFADDLRFNYFLTLSMVARGHSSRFFPISWREEDQVSNVNLVSQSTTTLRLLGQFALSRKWFMKQDRSAVPGRSYTTQVIFHSEASARDISGSAAP
jgi:dolichol-phosphate mannosyltransferase